MIKASVISAALFLVWILAFQDAARAEHSDLEAQASSLTDKARAHPLRVQSMEELVKGYPGEAFPLLISIFKDPQEKPALRYLAGEKLAAINRPLALKQFREVLDNPKENSFGRRSALAFLVSLDETHMRQKIQTILEDRREDPALRQYALGLYGRSEDPAGIEKLRRVVQSREETLSLRANALFILESLQDLEFVRSTIQRLVSDKRESAEWRKNCVVMIERLRDKEAVPILTRIAQDPSEPSSLRQLAASAAKRMRPDT